MSEYRPAPANSLWAEGLKPKCPPLRTLAEACEGSPMSKMLAQQAAPVDPNVNPSDTDRLTGQNADLLAWLQTGARVTAADAWERGIHRLAARVLDLRRAGYDVRSERDEAAKCHVYWLAKGKE